MKKTLQALIMAAAGVLLLVGCSEPPVLDATSEETLQASMAEMEKTLSPAEVEELRAAVKTIRVRETAVWAKKGVGRDAPELGRVCLSGMTAQEVLRFAKEGK